uniref:Uncharacterized protein n=1 Tax=Glossina austeni TaxID=7395 RepID=A0A1A9UTV0_GLOAU
MYTARASQFAKSITMACSVQKQTSSSAGPATPKSKAFGIPRGSLPTDMAQPPLEFQWPPPTPASTHTNNVRLHMMNQDPKDLHTARAMIEELRSKVRCQAEHIMKWRKTYALQVQQHYRYQKEKNDQLNALTCQLLLLESRLKRKQKQIASLLNHREMTIQRQQKIIDTLSTRLVDHGLETIEASYATELDSLNDSDSAVVLEDIDSDSNVTLTGNRRRSSGNIGNNMTSDGITIVRSISDAIETNLTKYGVTRRNNCFLRRPEILETVYSVEEDPEPTSDVAEKRDKFKQRSVKALSSSSTEGQIDNAELNTSPSTPTPTTVISAATVGNGVHITTKEGDKKEDKSSVCAIKNGHMKLPQLHNVKARSMEDPARASSMDDDDVNGNNLPKSNQVTNYNRVMSNHRSVTKPKDVKYKRINKAKSKSLEELRGRLKNLVEKVDHQTSAAVHLPSPMYAANIIPQTAQSYA